MEKVNYRYLSCAWSLLIIAFLLCPLFCFASGKEKPYKGYTGTVHQFGFIGGMYLTANPNFSAEDNTLTFHDYGLGASYTMHDYVTKQFTFDLMTSVTVITAKPLEVKGIALSITKAHVELFQFHYHAVLLPTFMSAMPMMVLGRYPLLVFAL